MNALGLKRPFIPSRHTPEDTRSEDTRQFGACCRDADYSGRSPARKKAFRRPSSGSDDETLRPGQSGQGATDAKSAVDMAASVQQLRDDFHGMQEMEHFIDMPDSTPELLADGHQTRSHARTPSRARQRSISVMTVSSADTPPRLNAPPDESPLPGSASPASVHWVCTPPETPRPERAFLFGYRPRRLPSPSREGPSSAVPREASPWSPMTPPREEDVVIEEIPASPPPPLLLSPSPSPTPPPRTRSATPQQQSIFSQQDLDQQQEEMDKLMAELSDMIATQEEGVSDGDSEDDDEDYETRRAKKLLKNHALMVKLGLAMPKAPDRSTSASPGPSPSPAGDAGDQDAIKTNNASSQAPPPPAPKPTRTRPERKLRLAEDGTTTCTPLPGTIHEMAYVDLLPLRERAKDDYVYVDDFPIRAPTPPPAPEPVQTPKHETLQSTKKSKPKAGPSKSRPTLSGTAKKRTPAQVLADDPTLADATSCHQCRRKTVEAKMRCANVGVTPDGKTKRCTLMFCRPCLITRYGANHPDQPDELWDADSTTWKCPKCRGICNCSNCLVRAGFQPEAPGPEGGKRTATLSRVLMIKDADGKRMYRSVRHYLEKIFGLMSTGEAWSAPAASGSQGNDQAGSEGGSDTKAHPVGDAESAEPGELPKKPRLSGRLVVRLKRPGHAQEHSSAQKPPQQSQAPSTDSAPGVTIRTHPIAGSVASPSHVQPLEKAPQIPAETVDPVAESRDRIAELERKNCWVKGPADLIDSDSESDLTDVPNRDSDLTDLSDEEVDELAADEETDGRLIQNHLRPHPPADGGVQLLQL